MKQHYTTIAYVPTGKLGLLVSQQHGSERITKIQSVPRQEQPPDRAVELDDDDIHDDTGIPILPPDVFRAIAPIMSEETRWSLLRPFKGSSVGLGVLAYCGEIAQEDHSDNAAVREVAASSYCYLDWQQLADSVLPAQMR